MNPMNPFAPEKREPVRYNWVKAIDRMPEDPAIHQYLLAYASDYGLVVTSLYPHGQNFWQPAMQVASLDHAMWFHRPFRMDGLAPVCDAKPQCLPSAGAGLWQNLHPRGASGLQRGPGRADPPSRPEIKRTGRGCHRAKSAYIHHFKYKD